MKEPNQVTTSTGVNNLFIPSSTGEGRSGGCAYQGTSQCFIYLSWELQALPTPFAIFQMGNQGTIYAVCELKGNCGHGKNHGCQSPTI